MDSEQKTADVRDLAIKVRQVFLIFPSEAFLEPLKTHSVGGSQSAQCVIAATEGMHRVISAASLPFQLVQDAVMQRQYDRIHASERILALIPEIPGSGLSEQGSHIARSSANQKMIDFLDSSVGKDIIRDEIIYDLHRRIQSHDVMNAAQELLIQTLISTWSIFESFARSFIISWLNDNPKKATLILNSQSFKEQFGKQSIDIQNLSDHNFDLSKSMGAILFNGRRLDSLGTIKNILKILFESKNIQTSLNEKLWILNQRRHLFVHNRGVVDSDYLKQTGDIVPLGERLILQCDDVENYLVTVRTAIIEISSAATESNGSN